MGKKERKIAGTPADPTLPKTPVEIGGRTYDLCFDFGALAEAETSINRELAKFEPQQRVNLLYAMAEENLGNTRVMLAAGLRTFHPEIAFADALRLVTADNLFLVTMAIRDAYKASTPEAKAGDPPQAAPAT